MANIDRLLKEYNNIIRLSDSKRQELILVRDNLRSRLKYGYQIVMEQVTLRFHLESQSQGSFVMDTIIRPVRDDYDLDDGLYFIGSLDRRSRPTPTEFHEWVMKAIDRGHDDIEKIIPVRSKRAGCLLLICIRCPKVDTPHFLIISQSVE